MNINVAKDTAELGVGYYIDLVENNGDKTTCIGFARDKKEAVQLGEMYANRYGCKSELKGETE